MSAVLVLTDWALEQGLLEAGLWKMLEKPGSRARVLLQVCLPYLQVEPVRELAPKIFGETIPPRLHVWSCWFFLHKKTHKALKPGKEQVGEQLTECRIETTNWYERAAFAMWSNCHCLPLASCFGQHDALRWLELRRQRGTTARRVLMRNTSRQTLERGVAVALDPNGPEPGLCIQPYRSEMTTGMLVGATAQRIPPGSHGIVLVSGSALSDAMVSPRSPEQQAELERAIAIEYYERTEAYDRSICTGGVHPVMGAQPRTNSERSRIAAHASYLRRELASRLGITVEAFRAILRQAPEHADSNWNEWIVTEPTRGTYVTTRRTQSTSSDGESTTTASPPGSSQETEQ